MEGAVSGDVMDKGSGSARRHAWRHLVAHLYEKGETERLFALVERQGFLAGQADFFGDFGRTGADVEAFLLPAAIGIPDWNRFFRYAAVALHLRGLAEALTEQEILEALAQSGRLRLATDLAGRLAEPLERAAALAVIAHQCRSDPALFRERLESVGQSLEAPLPPSPGPAEAGRRIELLARMAHRLGPDLTSWWPVWIGKAGLTPEQADPVWRAVAGSWLDRDDTENPAFWEALGEIRDSRTLLAFLPEALARRAPADPGEALARLSSLFSNEDERRRAVLLFLSRLAGLRPHDARALWDEKVSKEGLAWTMDLIETAGPLLALLDAERLEALSDGLDPVLQSAVRVVVLEASQTREEARSVLAVRTGRSGGCAGDRDLRPHRAPRPTWRPGVARSGAGGSGGPLSPPWLACSIARGPALPGGLGPPGDPLAPRSPAGHGERRAVGRLDAGHRGPGGSTE